MDILDVLDYVERILPGDPIVRAAREGLRLESPSDADKLYTSLIYQTNKKPMRMLLDALRARAWVESGWMRDPRGRRHQAGRLRRNTKALLKIIADERLLPL